MIYSSLWFLFYLLMLLTFLIYSDIVKYSGYLPQGTRSPGTQEGWGVLLGDVIGPVLGWTDGMLLGS